MERKFKLGDIALIASQVTQDAESESKPKSEADNEQREQLTVTVSQGDEEVCTHYLQTQNETVFSIHPRSRAHIQTSGNNRVIQGGDFGRNRSMYQRLPHTLTQLLKEIPLVDGVEVSLLL
jgi:translation elongation factor EF-G